MAEEATEPTLGTLRKRLQRAKDQRRIAKDHLPKAKAALMKVRRASREIIATAKKQHAVAKMEARIREDKKRLKRLHREDWGQLMLYLLLKVKIDYLERRSDWTRQTDERLWKGTGQLDESRKRIEDEQNLLEDKEREEQAAIEDVKKKRKKLDTLTEARKKEEAQAENHFRKALENVREKRRSVRMAASRVNSEALKSFWKFLADKIAAFGKWAGFAGVAGCVYAYAFLLGAAYKSSYFHLNGVNILSYMEPADFLTPGYSLAAFFLLMTLLVTLLLLPLYHLIRLIVSFRLPLYVEILTAVLSFFAKRIPKTSLFVLCCTVWVFSSLLVAAGAGDIWPPSQDCVSIVTDPPFQHQQKYVRIGSTSKYLFLREGADGCPVSSAEKAPAPNNNNGDWDLIDAIRMWLGSVWAGLKESLRAGDGGKPDSILVVPLSQITCISEIGGNGEGLCRPAVVKSPPPAKDPVDQHIADDMGCCPGKLDKSIFFSFVHDRGEVVDESPKQKPELEKVWKERIGEFVAKWNGKATKWRVYGFASLDGLSADNDKLSLERAETVRDMLCTASKTWSSREKCQEEVEIRYLGENHLVTAGPKSQSAVIAVCERMPEQNPEKATTPAGKAGSPSG